jgi:hypothetical protein
MLAAIRAAKGWLGAVGIRALRLFAPDSPVLDDAEAALVLGRIAALATHFSHLSP